MVVVSLSQHVETLGIGGALIAQGRPHCQSSLGIDDAHSVSCRGLCLRCSNVLEFPQKVSIGLATWKNGLPTLSCACIILAVRTSFPCIQASSRHSSYASQTRRDSASDRISAPAGRPSSTTASMVHSSDKHCACTAIPDKASSTTRPRAIDVNVNFFA